MRSCSDPGQSLRHILRRQRTRGELGSGEGGRLVQEKELGPRAPSVHYSYVLMVRRHAHRGAALLGLSALASALRSTVRPRRRAGVRRVAASPLEAAEAAAKAGAALEDVRPCLSSSPAEERKREKKTREERRVPA